MLTDQDIQKLTSVLVTKKDFEQIQNEMSSLRETIESLVTSIDGLTKVIEDLQVEYAAIKIQMGRHERWIKQIAEKTGVTLKI